MAEVGSPGLSGRVCALWALVSLALRSRRYTMDFHQNSPGVVDYFLWLLFHL